VIPKLIKPGNHFFPPAIFPVGHYPPKKNYLSGLLFYLYQYKSYSKEYCVLIAVVVFYWLA
jgi:hypothetical protein